VIRWPLAPLVAALLLAGCASGAPVRVSDPSDSPYRGTPLSRLPLPDVTLTDTAGRPFALRADTRRPVTVVFFGYTSCPDICPTTMADLALARRRLSASERERVSVVFVTTDPRRDTPRVVGAWLARFDPSFVGLTGPLPTIEKAAKALGVALTGEEKLPGGGYAVGHGSQVIAFGPDDDARVLWSGGTTVADYAHDLQLLTNSTE
jgi:protein SCO1/2